MGVDYNFLNRLTTNLLTTVKKILIMTSRATAYTLFSAPYVMTTIQNYEDMENPIIMCKAMATTLRVYWSSQFFLRQYHPLYWKMKILMLHMVMFPIYLFHELLQWARNELILMWFLIIHPIIPAKGFWMYWISMATTIWSLLLIEATEKLILPADVYWMDEFHHPFESTGNHIQHPLPEDWMVLSSVRLKMGFVGWLNKLGKYFAGMMSSLHQIGDNSVWLMLLAKQHYSTKLKGRMNDSVMYLLGVIANHIVGMGSQLGSLVLLMTGIVDSTCKTTTIYLIALLFLRLASLQPAHGMCIAQVVNSTQPHKITLKGGKFI